MAIKIGHASSDENRKSHGGAAGDQTGGEVCTRAWYSSPWNLVLRCTSATKAEIMAKACEAACANKKIGYDQHQRNTLQKQAKACGWDLSKITTACECDCSSLMTVCAQCAGIDIPYISGNAPYTGNMRQQFMSTGCFEALTDPKYLTSDRHLKRGDILVKTTGHTAMALEDGSAQAEKAAGYSLTEFIKDVQRACGASVDGIAGPETLRKTVTLSAWKNTRHKAVEAVQRRLAALGYIEVGKADGIAGPKFTSAVAHFQQDKGCVVDGVITAGAKTWRKLLGME